ncbi:MAG: soluble lytic murein transglycosylase and related regulatory protein [Rhodospirillaceae bacterium]|nr:MAG: soluble lytic murein transglycosylase and related regulatory protein [Rhodospirillaceae bacterium]
MQVNLYYHPNAFATLDQAFDPETNAEYAAAFLSGLYDETGDWLRAASYYHSRDLERGKTYRAKVVKTWETHRHMVLARQTPPPEPPRPAAPSRRLDTPALQGITTRQAEVLARTLAEREAAREAATVWRTARMQEWEARRAARLSRAAAN